MEETQQGCGIGTPSENKAKGKVEKKGGKRIGLNYIILKSLKESQKNDVIKCLFIKSFKNFGLCVIKEGAAGDTKDKQGRDIIDRLKWQRQLHLYLEDKLPIPRLIDDFEENGNYYLVIGHITGVPLQKLITQNKISLRSSILVYDKQGRKFLSYLVQIGKILKNLHNQQIVHRDATPNNFIITKRGKVSMIDMEMSYSINSKYPAPAFQLGTYGYMSPQQERTETPTISEDIFALGAIILLMWSNISSVKFLHEPWENSKTKIRFFIPDQILADLVIDCLCPEISYRPSIDQVLTVLSQLQKDFKTRKKRLLNEIVSVSRVELLNTIQSGINALATPLLADRDKGWFANDMQPLVERDKHKLRKCWYASYHRGVLGICYSLMRAKQQGFDVDSSQVYLQKALALVKEKYIDSIGSAALYYGSDGVAVVMNALNKHQMFDFGNNSFLIKDLIGKSTKHFDIARGIAGQGIAMLLCSDSLESMYSEQKLKEIADVLIKRQDSTGGWVTGSSKTRYLKIKKKVIPMGFDEGAAGVIYFLLEYSNIYKDAVAFTAARNGLQWLMRSVKVRNGQLTWRRADQKREINYGFSSGVAGIAFTFLRAFQISSNSVYANFARKLLQGIPSKFTDNNLGQRSGLSGLGEVYLEAYHLLKEKVWLERATWIAQVIFHLKKSGFNNSTYWLVESEREPVANFMTGTSGILHFLLRYCYPDTIKFPFIK